MMNKIRDNDDRFMNLPEEYTRDNSKFLIINIPWEKNVTYGRGADRGPKEIIKASHQLEYFDIVDDLDLQSISSWKDKGKKVGCIAVFCGNVRLIDNIVFIL